VPFALGQRLLVHHIFGRGVIGLIAVVASALLPREAGQELTER